MAAGETTICGMLKLMYVVTCDFVTDIFILGSDIDNLLLMMTFYFNSFLVINLLYYSKTSYGAYYDAV